MADRLQELRRIAEAATPGPWEVVGLDGYGGPYALRMPHRSGRTWYGVEGIKRREDAEYFVAMNRNTVLALLDEIERLAMALNAYQMGLRYAVRVWVLSDEIVWSEETIDDVVENIIDSAKKEAGND